MTRIGLYAGTFDPVTNGHLDIIRRGTKIVDRLVIGVAVNGGKGPLFTLEERVSIVERETAGFAAPGVITVKPFNNLLMHFADQVGAQTIIRGLRAVSDFDYEFQMVGMNHKLNPDVETVFLMADPQHQAIASTLVKEIAKLGGDVHHFAPPGVVADLLAKVGR